VKSSGNYDYAIVYGLELIEEYKRRYSKLHRTEGVLLWLKAHLPDIPNGPLTRDVSLTMPDRKNPTQSYIIGEKSNIVSWKRSNKVPDWYERFVYTNGRHRVMGQTNAERSTLCGSVSLIQETPCWKIRHGGIVSGKENVRNIERRQIYNRDRFALCHKVSHRMGTHME
jgi:hypothetical protein